MTFPHVNILIKTYDGMLSLYRGCTVEINAEDIHIYYADRPVNTDCAIYSRGAVTSIHILGRTA